MGSETRCNTVSEQVASGNVSRMVRSLTASL